MNKVVPQILGHTFMPLFLWYILIGCQCTSAIHACIWTAQCTGKAASGSWTRHSNSHVIGNASGHAYIVDHLRIERTQHRIWLRHVHWSSHVLRLIWYTQPQSCIGLLHFRLSWLWTCISLLWGCDVAVLRC